MTFCAITSLSFGEPATPPSQTLTFYHWWTSPSETAALGALVKLFSAKYPDVRVVSPTLPPGPKVRALFPVLQRLAAAKQPPDAFQMSAGYGAQVFYDAGLLSPIDDLWKSEDLASTVPPIVRELSQFDGHYYSVPSNLHRVNVIWYNKALLDKHKIEPDTLTTWDAFFKATATLKNAGVRDPIQIPVRANAIVFEGMLAGLGIGAYEDWINGRITDAKDPRLVKSVTLFKTYLTYANKDSAALTWTAAVKRIADGEGAICILGDWADAEFRANGEEYGKDYGSLLLPGTKGMFGLIVDAFHHPRGLADPTNSERWLRLVISREGQDAFNPLKGSISARNDADIRRYDPYQRMAIADLRSAKSLYPSLGMAVPEAFASRVHEILADFTSDPNADKAEAALADVAVTLKGKRSRTWSLK